jgi:hypothetical protein
MHLFPRRQCVTVRFPPQAWEVMDRDGDGRVDKEEFKSFAERKGVSVWYIV